MTELDSSMLRLRARMFIRSLERKLQRCTDEEKKSRFWLRAYHLGREYPCSEINPFERITHPFQSDLIHGFSVGSVAPPANAGQVASVMSAT